MDVASFLAPPRISRALLTSPSSLFSGAISLRLVLLLYGIYQDTHAPLKYTDIDYYVFTDAARFAHYGYSPYLRDTYRYTPLLAWVLLPTTWKPPHIWFSFGKALFAASDIVAGWLIFVLLQKRGLAVGRALRYSAIWLLNPMVAAISTRGSSEGLLCVMVMALLWATEMRHIALAGALLGLSVHFKIYPFIYGITIVLSLGEPSSRSRYRTASSPTLMFQNLITFLNRDRSTFIFTSLATFSILNIAMYSVYGIPFMQHTYLHHLTRIDHRHNFSPFNTLLYLSSSSSSSSAHPAAASSRNISLSATSVPFESLAFVPQLLLSTILIPLTLLSKPRLTSSSLLPNTMLAQTFAFVTFNKVCTSQYFLWYLVFLPIYLPNSILMRKPALGLTTLGTWVAGQAVWLWQAYRLEMGGQSTFLPGLWLSSLIFFAVNCWILGVVVVDDGRDDTEGEKEGRESSKQPPENIVKLQRKSDMDNDDDDDDSDVEEITRDRTVDEMVRQEMSRRRKQPRPVRQMDDDDDDEEDVNGALLRDYMADVQKVVAQSPEFNHGEQ